MEYNSQREGLRLREYGRHLQRLVDKALEIEDRQKRQDAAEAIVQVMATLNPQLKHLENHKQLFWDHLHILSNWTLDVDSPYPPPAREEIEVRPDPFPYPAKTVKHRHYGQHVQTLIDKVDDFDDAEKKDDAAKCIADYMKLVYNTNNRHQVNDAHIKNDLETISDGRLSLDKETRLQHVKVEPQKQKKGGRGRGRGRGRKRSGRRRGGGRRR